MPKTAKFMNFFGMVQDFPKMRAQLPHSIAERKGSVGLIEELTHGQFKASAHLSTTFFHP